MNNHTAIHFSVGECQRSEARIRALEERVEQLTYERDHWKREACQLVESDQVDVIGTTFGLTPPEAIICTALYQRREKLLPATSLEDLLDEERGYSLESNIISVMIGKIRDKLGSDAIETVRGRGYRLSQAMLVRFDRKIAAGK